MATKVVKMTNILWKDLKLLTMGHFYHFGHSNISEAEISITYSFFICSSYFIYVSYLEYICITLHALLSFIILLYVLYLNKRFVDVPKLGMLCPCIIFMPLIKICSQVLQYLLTGPNMKTYLYCYILLIHFLGIYCPKVFSRVEFLLFSNMYISFSNSDVI